MGFKPEKVNPILIAERERGLKLDGLDPLFLRKEGDSNPRTGFAGYTLSRRASSATRASLLGVVGCGQSTFGVQIYCISLSFHNFSAIIFLFGTFFLFMKHRETEFFVKF